MTRGQTIGWTLLGVLVLLPVLTLVLVNTPPGRSAVSLLATHMTGRQVSFTGAVYPILPPGLHISGLTIANRAGGREENMAQIGVLEMELALRALFKHGHWRLRSLSLVDSDVHLERDAQGRANWQFSDTPDEEPSQPLALGLLYFENSRLTYYDEPQKTDLRLTASTQEDHFLLTGAGIHLGKPFALKGEVAGSCLSRRAHSCPVETTLTVGNTTVHAKGALNQVMPPEGADFMLDIKGADAAELFPLLGIALPPTAPYHLNGRLTYENERWHFDDFTGGMGESDLQGSLTWDTSLDRPKLTANFISKKLRFLDLGPLIGLAPQQQLSDAQKQRARREEESPYVIPDVKLDIEKVASMDADVEFEGKQVISENLPLDDFYLKLSLDNSLMKLNPVRFGTAQGNISAVLTVNARQQPVSNHADISFSHLKLAKLLGNAGKSIADVETPTGEIGGTMQLSGPGKSLHEILGHADGVAGLGMEGGTISNLLVKLLSLDVARSLGFILAGDEPLGIRCVVASFDVKKGLMTTDQFVIDTDDTNINGEGTVNLDTEELDLRLLPAPKKASLLSLRSPIGLEGTLKKPDVTIEKGPLAARGGIATAIAAVAPVAAVVAFLDAGLGKDSNCTALIQAMDEKTGKHPPADQIPKNP